MPSSFYKVTGCWAVLVVVGISSFIYSKNSVIARRREDMQSRERMRRSNVGQYESEYNRK